MIREGDRVTVTVRGHRAPATVTSRYTALGNVEVELDEPIDDVGAGMLPVRRVVRGPADVQMLRPDPTRVIDERELRDWRCEECRAPWPVTGDQCTRCGNRTRTTEPEPRAMFRETFTIGGRFAGELVIPHDEEISVTTEVRGWRAWAWKIRHPFRWAS